MPRWQIIVVCRRAEQLASLLHLSFVMFHRFIVCLLHLTSIVQGYANPHSTSLPFCHFDRGERTLLDCSLKGDCTSGTQLCTCRSGYKGQFCEEVSSLCPPNRCASGVKCVNRGSWDECLCPSGFQGPTCSEPSVEWQTVDLPFYCQHGGTCLFSSQLHVYRCLCAAGYVGQFCESSAAVPEVVPPGEFVPVTTTLRASTESITSSATTTTSTSSSTTPTAGLPSVRIVQGPCSPNPCMHGGSCNLLIPRSKRSPLNKADWLSYQCDCPPCTSGERCEHLIDPCQQMVCHNGGECAVDRDCMPYCNCKANGYVGFECQFEQQCDPCQVNPCRNGGSCRLQWSSFVCVCAPGFSGRLCEQVANPCATITSCRRAEAECVVQLDKAVCMDRAQNPCLLAGFDCAPSGHCALRSHEPECVCPENYGGEQCAQPLDPCLTQPCLFGGRCERKSLLDFTCICPPHQSGQYCEQCDPCNPNPCLHGGRCFANRTDLSFTCQCVPDWNGTVCAFRGDPCAHHPCLHGAQCKLDVFSGRPSCSCPSGFTGSYCEHRDLCVALAPCATAGSNGCLMHEDGTFECRCKADFMGHNCAYSTAIVALESFCERYKPCQAGGICEKYSSAVNYTCICPEKARGVDCQWNMCSLGKFPCVNGYCTLENDGEARCDCSKTMYEGRFCQKFSAVRCRSELCHDQGNCTFGKGTLDVRQVICECDGDWTGQWCDWNRQWTTRTPPTTLPSTPAPMNCSQISCGHGFKCAALQGERFKCLRDFSVTLPPLPPTPDPCPECIPAHPCLSRVRCNPGETCVLFVDSSVQCVAIQSNVTTRKETKPQRTSTRSTSVKTTTTASTIETTILATTTTPRFVPLPMTAATEVASTTTEEPFDYGSWKFVLPMVLVGVFLLIVLVVVCVCCCHRRRKKKKKQQLDLLRAQSERSSRQSVAPSLPATPPTTRPATPATASTKTPDISTNFSPNLTPITPVAGTVTDTMKVEVKEKLQFPAIEKSQRLPESSAEKTQRSATNVEPMRPPSSFAPASLDTTGLATTQTLGSASPMREPQMVEMDHRVVAKSLLLALATGEPIKVSELSSFDPEICLVPTGKLKGGKKAPPQQEFASPVVDTTTPQPPSTFATPSPISPITTPDRTLVTSPPKTSLADRTQISALQSSPEPVQAAPRQTSSPKQQQTQLGSPPKVSPIGQDHKSTVMAVKLADVQEDTTPPRTESPSGVETKDTEMDAQTMALALLVALADGRCGAEGGKYGEGRQPSIRLVGPRQSGGRSVGCWPGWDRDFWSERLSSTSTVWTTNANTYWPPHTYKPYASGTASAILPGSDF